MARPAQYCFVVIETGSPSPTRAWTAIVKFRCEARRGRYLLFDRNFGFRSLFQRSQQREGLMPGTRRARAGSSRPERCSGQSNNLGRHTIDPHIRSTEKKKIKLDATPPLPANTSHPRATKTTKVVVAHPTCNQGRATRYLAVSRGFFFLGKGFFWAKKKK